MVLFKVLQPNKHFNWQMGSRICDGFIGHHNRRWDFPLVHGTARVGLHLPVLIILQTPYTALVFQKKEMCNTEWAILDVRYCSCQIGSQSDNTCGEGLLTARSVRGMGVIAWAVGVCRKIWFCVLIPVRNFYSALWCLFWHALPYIVCYCVSFIVVSCLRQCHCIVQVFCVKIFVFVQLVVATQAVHSVCL